jgi:hypothetical protein
VEQANPSNGPVSLIGEQHLAEMILAATASPPGGAFVEVGVFRGGSAWRLYGLAEQQGREIYLYDTFTGIPWRDAIDSHSVGDFSDTNYDHMVELFAKARVVKGIFPDSAIPMPGIAFAHLDCDQYRSVKESIEYLRPRMLAGGVMWFDDSPCLAGAKLAVFESFAPSAIRISSDHGKNYVTF